jgi:hypothetical protein
MHPELKGLCAIEFSNGKQRWGSGVSFSKLLSTVFPQQITGQSSSDNARISTIVLFKTISI